MDRTSSHISLGIPGSFFVYFNNYSFYNNKLANFFSERQFFGFQVLRKIETSKKKLPGWPRKTSPSTNAFWFFSFKWFCCELWCTPQNNFFSRRLRRFTVTRSIFNILQWKFRQILFKCYIIIWRLTEWTNTICITKKNS